MRDSTSSGVMASWVSTHITLEAPAVQNPILPGRFHGRPGLLGGLQAEQAAHGRHPEAFFQQDLPLPGPGLPDLVADQIAAEPRDLQADAEGPGPAVQMRVDPGKIIYLYTGRPARQWIPTPET